MPSHHPLSALDHPSTPRRVLLLTLCLTSWAALPCAAFAQSADGPTLLTPLTPITVSPVTVPPPNPPDPNATAPDPNATAPDPNATAPDPNARPDDAWDNPPVDDAFDDLTPPPPILTPPDFRWGFGFGLQPLALNNATLLLTFDNRYLRTEFGFLLAYDRRVGNSPSRTESESTLELVSNLGLFFHNPITEYTSLYVGARTGISWLSTSFSSTDTASAAQFEESTSGLGFHFTPVFAGEYLFWPSLAIALEVQLDLAYFPEDTVDPAQSSRLATSRFTFDTNASVMLRWFF